MRLQALIIRAGLADALPMGDVRHVAAECEIRGLTADSRAVKPGFLFAALPGQKAQGRDFIEAAVQAGAAAVLTDQAAPANSPVPFVSTRNPRLALSRLAAAFYGAQPETVVAVTGTSGKTSTVQFARQLWAKSGARAASLGTLGITRDEGTEEGELTTADPVTLHQILARLAHEGITHLAMEASSHGLDQFRLDGVRLRAAGFTNLSRDHLDYHGTMAAYLAAKARLFDEVLAADGIAVLNADIPEFDVLAGRCRAAGRRYVSYGDAGQELRLLKHELLSEGQRLTLSVFGQPHSLTLPLAGRFQGMNVLCALGLVLASGLAVDAAIAAAARLTGVCGRLEYVGSRPAGGAVYVDYAHKPDALEKVLGALRPHAEGRLIVLFGCGGDRDPGKRPQMGAIAQKLADHVIVTDDNPRTEDAAKIRRQILEACPEAEEIGGRGEAIHHAIGILRAGDVLILAGKGHETYQIIGQEKFPFDDRAVARNALKEGLA